MSIARQKFPVQCIKYFSILNCGVCKLQVNFRWMVSNGWYQMDPDSYENMHHINTDSYENVYQMDPDSYINIHHMDPDTYKNIHRMDPDSYMKTYITWIQTAIWKHTSHTRRIEYILEGNLLEKSVKRPFCWTVSILQVYFTYLCYITCWALDYHFI